MDINHSSVGEIKKLFAELSQPFRAVFAIRCALRAIPYASVDGRFPEIWHWEEATAPLNVLITASAYSISSLVQPKHPESIKAHEDTVQELNIAHDAAISAASINAVLPAAAAYASVCAGSFAINDEKSAYKAIVAAYASAAQYLDMKSSALLLAVADSEFADLANISPKLGILRGVLLTYTKPLWPARFEGWQMFAPKKQEWASSLLQIAGKRLPQLAGEIERLIKIYNSFVDGAPVWSDFLAPSLFDELRSEFPELFGGVRRSSLPLDELLNLVARLAFLDPACLSLAEAPTAERFQLALQRRTMAGADSVLQKARLLSDGLVPDPLWQSWFVATQSAFLNQPLPRTLPIPWESERIPTSGTSKTQNNERLQQENQESEHDRSGRVMTPRKSKSRLPKIK